jgi:beta-N-acetylhexosaminidase
VSLCAAIFGLAGPVLSEDERSFFRAAAPAGFILFARNCQTPAQVRRLTDALREVAQRVDVAILIDQEGGRVARLKPPHWRAAPPAATFGTLADRDLDAAMEAVRLNAALIGQEARDLGFTIDCLPVLDLRLPETHAAIGDRAFHPDPAIVAALGRAAADGLLSAGVLPVIKHMPGHGRSTVDSHLDLPRVAASLATLRASDFQPFRALRTLPIGMTSHLLYEAVDPDNPATLSPKVIAEIIRGEIGFEGLLLSDDLSMKALRGSIGERAGACLAAGCDIALHCNGILAEMEEVAAAAGTLGAAGQGRLDAAWRRLKGTPPSSTTPAMLAERLDQLLHARA